LGRRQATASEVAVGNRMPRGDVYADGVDELLYGRLSNVL
jgi:hypothetical protein